MSCGNPAVKEKFLWLMYYHNSTSRGECMKRFSMLYCRNFPSGCGRYGCWDWQRWGSQPLLFSFSELWSGRRFEQAYDGSGAPAAAVILVGAGGRMDGLFHLARFSGWDRYPFDITGPARMGLSGKNGSVCFNAAGALGRAAGRGCFSATAGTCCR